ncbi:MAG: hypothetical protein ACYS8X_10300 [Planctomycetota bacterium]
MTGDATTLAKLDELMAAIGTCDDPRRASAEWKQAYKLLQATDLPGPRVTHVVGMRDVAGLTELVDQLRAPADAAPPADAAGAVDEATCKRALKAFRKRLSLTVLDEESKLGRSPLTKGSGASTAAITPPVEYPDEVWQELVRQGKLHYMGHGFYELPKH